MVTKMMMIVHESYGYDESLDRGFVGFVVSFVSVLNNVVVEESLEID